MTRYSERFQVTKRFNTLKLYTLKALLSKNRFYFFFLIFRHAKVPPAFRMPRYLHKFSLIFVLVLFVFQI